MTTVFKILVAGTGILLFGSCGNNYKVDEFTNEGTQWYRPFDKTDTVIFKSEKGEADTIIFYGAVESIDSTSDFEQGYSKSRYLSVPYEFTKGSYHQFAIMDGETRYKGDFLNMAKSSSGYGSLEITFIGTIFSDETLSKIQKIDSNSYFFNSEQAEYSGMNVEKGIKNFIFNIEVGIVSYTDDRGVKWRREET